MTELRVPAVGGQRLVPVPDPFAREYLLLALRLEQLRPGLVDAYFGPAELKARVDVEQLPGPAALVADAASLRERLPEAVHEPDRRAWLEVQLGALEAQAETLAGRSRAARAGDARAQYLDLVTRCIGLRPERVPESVFEAAAAELERLVPGSGSAGAAPLAERVAAWEDRFVVPADRLPGVVGWLVELFRSRTAAQLGLPDGESVEIGLVTGQPWAAYNWYLGGGRSRIDLNTDLPARAGDLPRLLAHETYPGHHTEHVWKERLLVEGLGRLEASVQLINAPECLISEGLADIAERFVADAGSPDLLVELFERAGLPVAADRSAALDAAERQLRIKRALEAVRGVRGNAALLLHADGAPRDEVLAYLRRYMLTTPERAAKAFEFIEHPLWRTYVFVYFEGERLLSAWLGAPAVAAAAGEHRPGGPAGPAGAAPDAAGAATDAAGTATARFGRLLREQLTPAALAADLRVRA